MSSKSIFKKPFLAVVIFQPVTSAVNEHNFYGSSIIFSWGQNGYNAVNCRNPSAPTKCIRIFNPSFLDRRKWVLPWKRAIFVKIQWHKYIITTELNSLEFRTEKSHSTISFPKRHETTAFFLLERTSRPSQIPMKAFLLPYGLPLTSRNYLKKREVLEEMTRNK